MRQNPTDSAAGDRAHRTVLVDINLSYGYGRGIVEGLSQYLKPGKSWHTVLVPHNPERGEYTMQWSTRQGYHLNGVIAQVTRPEHIAFYQRTGLPVINISSRRPAPFPSVTIDQNAVGRMAAEHLLNQGLRHFAFVEMREGADVWQTRFEGFRDRIERAGHACHSLSTERVHKSGQFMERLGRWLRRMPKPCGLMAFNDAYAAHLVSICRLHGIEVPEEAAVIGVDNDSLVCEQSAPPLSSVQLPLERVGFEAAGMLDQVMDGQPPPPSVLLQPIGVVTRRSTDMLALEDRRLIRILRFIREHACEGIRVEDAVAVAPVTRRWVERHFRAALGRSPAEEIRRVRIEHAEACLAHTDLSLPEIAFRCGFSSHTRFGTVFRRLTGTTPSAYRKRVRPQETTQTRVAEHHEG